MKACVVLGTAPCMFDDLERVPVADIMAVNRAGVLYLGPLRHWSSVHGSALVEWIEERRRRGGSMDFRAFGNFQENQDSGMVERLNRPNWRGSSALYATRLAIEHGWDRVILCGVPLAGHETLGLGEIHSSVTPYDFYRHGWERHADELREHVRSMSGWTRDYFGAPPPQWLNE